MDRKRYGGPGCSRPPNLSDLGVGADQLLGFERDAPVVGALLVEQLSATQAHTFYFLGDVFLYPAAMGAAVLVGATALVALRTAVLPRSAAWPSLALALWLLIPPLGQGVDALENPALWTGLAVLPFVLVWTALIAVGLMRAPDE